MTSGDIPVLKTVAEVRSFRSSLGDDASVGFVPTMGFLHDGHLSLIEESLKVNDFTMISIFVNPAQFAPGEDLDAYPRDLNHDLDVLSHLSKPIDAIFYPSVDEMYPLGIPLEVENQVGAFVEVKGLSEVLEGKTRPNFFRGVSTVVVKLFNIVKPNNVYFGQKDIQQTIVVKRLIKDLFLDLQITIVPIKRNADGLALSSRNKYLSEDIKNQATCIYKGLLLAKKAYEVEEELDVSKLTQIISDSITSTNGNFKIDYISINDGESLEYLTRINKDNGAVISLAVYVPNSLNAKEKTRLIDNIIL